jgi:hypothetical protein
MKLAHAIKIQITILGVCNYMRRIYWKVPRQPPNHNIAPPIPSLLHQSENRGSSSRYATPTQKPLVRTAGHESRGKNAVKKMWCVIVSASNAIGIALIR